MDIRRLLWLQPLVHRFICTNEERSSRAAGGQSAPFCNAGGSVIKPGFAISFFTFLLYPRDYVSITHLTFIGLVNLQGDVVKYI